MWFDNFEDIDENLLITNHPNHVCVIIHWNDALEHGGKEEEGLLLSELHGE